MKVMPRGSSIELAREMVNEVDKNNDGRVDYAEVGAGLARGCMGPAEWVVQFRRPACNRGQLQRSVVQQRHPSWVSIGECRRHSSDRAGKCTAITVNIPLLQLYLPPVQNCLLCAV